VARSRTNPVLTIPCSVVDGYIAVTQPNLEARAWHRQDSDQAPFYCRHRPGTEADIVDMLLGRNWIACRAPEDGMIDRLSFDVDLKEGQPDPRDTYEALRCVLGRGREPLVYRTPGGGLRVVYRIPRVPRESLVSGARTGVVADVLRGAGLVPRKGFLEIFPQGSLPERLMLGARMPLLDPDSLKPLRGCNIGVNYEEKVLRACLERVEAWHASPYHDLLAHLERTPKLPRGEVVSRKEEESYDSIFVRDTDGKVRPSGSLLQLLTGGLVRAGSRFDCEFLVAMAMAVAPEQFADYGLGRAFTPWHLATAVARWLARHHNGFSREWIASVRQHGSPESAVLAWADRYLKPSEPTGLNMVDRAMRAAQSADPLSARVRQLTDDEWRNIFHLAERYFDGAARLRFEVWTGSFYRAVKEIVHHHERNPPRPGELRRMESLTDMGGRDWVEVEIAAEWQEEWPYGSGGKGGRTKYLLYRRILEAEGLVVQRTAHRHCRAAHESAPEDSANLAASFLLLRPSVATLRDVRAAPGVLKKACEGITVSGRGYSLDEAYHALYAVGHVRDLRRRYGYSASRGLRERVKALRENLEWLRSVPDDRLAMPGTRRPTQRRP
jgi:hypothetical protein